MSSSFWRRLLAGDCCAEAQPDWLRLVGDRWPAQIMDVACTGDFHAKQGRSTGRWLAQQADERLPVYLKRHYRLPRWLGLLAALWPKAAWSPALQEWHNLRWAQAHGFAVPRPVAVAQYVGPWGKLQSVLAVDELVDMLPLHQAIPLAAAQLPGPVFARWKRSLTRRLAEVVRALHAHRRYHKDLYLCHFYIPRQLAMQAAPPDWQLHVIDLHRLAHHPWTWPLWQVKDLAQLLFSTDVVGVSARDRLRFWRCYLGDRRRTLLGRGLALAVRLKTWRYRDHNGKQQRRAA